ncbi:MAG: hypothetical protein HYZ26_04675 [Chloroflexi bacterium]|nr:hypothetical protein [Chloroflexota bacterium]
MSAPLIWIVFPGALGFLLLLLAGRPRLANGLAVGAAFLLAWAALLLPIDQPLTLGGATFKVAQSLFLLGRSLTLTPAQQPLLMGIWGVTFLWLVGALFARPHGLFAPTALFTIAFLTASFSVEPFLYAALMFELTALFAVPLLAPPGSRSRPAVLRFLAFMTIGMPFILFVGWMLAGVAASPGILVLAVRAGLLLGIGFVFLLGIFPFHSWMPMLAESANPYAAAFVLLMLPSAVGLFGLELLDRYAFLRQSEALFALLRSAGALMALVSGLFVGLERHLGRMLGFAVVLETGLSLLAIGLNQPIGFTLFFALLLPRAVSFLVWSGTLSNLQQEVGASLTLARARGLAGVYPLRSAGLLLAIFSLAGLPLLSGFPFRWLLGRELAADFPWAAAAALAGSLGLLLAGVRVIAALVSEPEVGTTAAGPLEGAPSVRISAAGDSTIWLFLIFGALGSLLVGFFPHWFWPFFVRLPLMFSQLGR